MNRVNCIKTFKFIKDSDVERGTGVEGVEEFAISR